jgi:hypothetical protein
MIKKIILAIFLCQFTYSQQVLDLKDRAILIEKIQKDRLDNLLPKLMSKNEIDMWIIITREYNEDPIIKTLLPPTWLNARRRTILVFSYNELTNKTESVAISRYSFGNNIKSIWDKEETPNQLMALKEYINTKNPKTIGLNYSENFPLVDGISKSDYELFYNSMSAEIKKNIVSAENLGIQWIETRTELEKKIYKDLVNITQNIINEAFSNKVIKPGITTTDDVVWWMREKVLELKLKTWFHPTVDVQRNKKSDLYAFDGKSKYDIIQPGDLVHNQTGKPMPKELIAKIKKASTFNQGFETTEYLASAIMDMKFHLADPTNIDVDKFERETLADLDMPSELPMRHRTPHFGHVFSGEGYATAYYGYMWADVLTADASEAFTEAPGGFYDKDVAKKLVDYLFSPRNSIDPEEAYRLFRGRDAKIEALMRDRGFPIKSE